MVNRMWFNIIELTFDRLNKLVGTKRTYAGGSLARAPPQDNGAVNTMLLVHRTEFMIRKRIFVETVT